MSQILQICAAPGTGKNAIVRELLRMLNVRDTGQWAAVDNEYGYGGYSPLERWMDSKVSGLELDSKEFAMKYNLNGQLEYQKKVRKLATVTGLNVIMPGPFENLYMDIPMPDGTKLPLLQKLRSFDFVGFDLKTIQIALVPAGFEGTLTKALLEDEGWVKEVAEVFMRRLSERIEKKVYYQPLLARVQRELDAKKMEDPEAYVKARLGALLETSARFETPLFCYPANCTPQALAEEILSYV